MTITMIITSQQGIHNSLSSPHCHHFYGILPLKTDLSSYFLTMQDAIMLGFLIQSNITKALGGDGCLVR